MDVTGLAVGPSDKPTLEEFLHTAVAEFERHRVWRMGKRGGEEGGGSGGEGGGGLCVSGEEEERWWVGG